MSKMIHTFMVETAEILSRIIAFDQVIHEARNLEQRAAELMDEDELGNNPGEGWEALEDARAEFVYDVATLLLSDEQPEKPEPPSE